MEGGAADPEEGECRVEGEAMEENERRPGMRATACVEPLHRLRNRAPRCRTRPPPQSSKRNDIRERKEQGEEAREAEATDGAATKEAFAERGTWGEEGREAETEEDGRRRRRSIRCRHSKPGVEALRAKTGGSWIRRGTRLRSDCMFYDWTGWSNPFRQTKRKRPRRENWEEDWDWEGWEAEEKEPEKEDEVGEEEGSEESVEAEEEPPTG